MKPVLLIAVTIALIAAACGSDQTTPSDGGGSAPPDTSLPTTTTPDGPLGAGPYPVVTLELTVTHPEAEALTYTISCLGDTATITGDVPLDPDRACEALGREDVRTRLVEGPPADQVCAEIYGGPDVATITGSYDGVDGVPVDTTVDRTNGCGISDWDTLLADILPPALGVVEATS